MVSTIEKALSKFKIDSSKLTDDINLVYVNKFGETITLKVDENGSPFYNHTDIHEKDEFYPTETKVFIVLDEDEKAIIVLFETMVLIQKKYKIV